MMPTDPLDSSLPYLPHLPRLLEVSQVALRLGFSPEYVRRLIRNGDLAAIRFGIRWRVDPADVQAFIQKQRRERSNGHG
jgi:excisionase family DNA binding protein